MPEIPDSLLPKERNTKDSADLIRWHTVSYRTLLLWVLLAVSLVAGIVLAVVPQWREGLQAWLFGGGNGGARVEASVNRQARFTNLDGGVRVRRAQEVEWASADLSMELDKGDLVQTSRDGVARIAFADGTLYVVRPTTLIVIEENNVPSDKSASNVAVQVSSGMVDLSTTRITGRSRVLFADAEAQLRNESRALVRNDPQTNTREITVSKGGARLMRGSEQMELGEYEQAAFAGPGSAMTRKKIVAPPLLLTPGNMAPVVMSGSESTEVEFIWSAIPTATSYRIRVSSSPIFAHVLYEREVRSTSIRLPSFKEGDYYWAVTSLSADKRESQQSEPNQFSVIKQENAEELLLVVEKTIQHGRVIEVIGRTEPGATVLVNNEPVFSVAANGSFKHFTSPLPNTGSNRITITAQNSEGKVATVRKTITIQ
ncbi:MAG: hypothetical protein HY316_10680 [Acidobacteria bacterium]|nr:hypothetical protein [Acidobacteriota bacterium]